MIRLFVIGALIHSLIFRESGVLPITLHSRELISCFVFCARIIYCSCEQVYPIFYVIAQCVYREWGVVTFARRLYAHVRIAHALLSFTTWF